MTTFTKYKLKNLLKLINIISNVCKTITQNLPPKELFKRKIKVNKKRRGFIERFIIMYIYIHTYMLCIYLLYIYIFIYSYIYIYIYLFIYMYIEIYIYTYIQTNEQVRVKCLPV